MGNKNTKIDLYSIAELRTIGLYDATSDSELSIRHLELTPNPSVNSFRLSPNAQYTPPKRSKESIDSGCQNEAQNCENNRYDKWHHCDLNIVDITKHNSNSRKKETLELTICNRKSSSSTLSDASSCGTNRSTPAGQQKKRKESPKYHSVTRVRTHKDSLVSRSKSFQEQDVRKSKVGSRFYNIRRNPQSDLHEFQLNKTISHHNIEITIEDTDAQQQPFVSRNLATSSFIGSHNECSSYNSGDMKYDRHKARSGHILSRIFRRMRNLSMAWRKTKNKSRNRGEPKFSIIRLVTHNQNQNQN